MPGAHPLSRLVATAGAALLVATSLTACSGSNEPQPISNEQLGVALRQHAAAVRDHNRETFLSGISDAPGSRSYRQAQAAEFANLSLVPLSRWTYSLAAPVRATQAQAKARSTFGPTARIVKVTLHYAITGVDPVATEQSLWWTVARVDGRVVICADDGLARQGGVSWRGPWDFGPLAVARGTHSLVLGPSDDGQGLRQIAAVVDRAVPAVTAIWGTSWPQDVLVIVPSNSQAQQAALGGSASATAGSSDGTSDGSPQQADDVAVTVSDGQDPVSGQVEGLRIVVEQRAFDRLSTLGRQIVFTHEVTHVASAAATGGASPRWLVEGFAEYVANLHTGLAVRSAAAELVTRIRRDGLPRALPGEDAFDAASTAAAAYEQAWLACRLIATRAGAPGLVRFYRLVGGSGLSTATAVRSALRSVLHETPAGFTARWRTYVRDLLS